MSVGARAVLLLFSAVTWLAACGGADERTGGAGGGPAAGSGGAGGGLGATTSASTGATSSATSVSSSTGVGGSEPDFASIPWETGASVGFGVARKDGQNHLGDAVFIGYAGYAIPLDAGEAWVSALYESSLRARGVRWVYAVQGPADPSYSQFEIGNSKIAAALGTEVQASTPFVLVAAHSSGSFVAHELLGQLAGGLDPGGVTAGKIVYFDLDGGQSGLTQASVDRLRKAYFTSAFDAGTGTYSPNHGTMTALGATYASKGGYFDTDASAAGCQAGATWCLHMTLITTRPHDPTAADGVPDYSDFAGRPVQHDYVDAKAAEAGLGP